MGHEHVTNGNHSHEHIHNHSHEHTHDGHTHTHEHDHVHEHDHTHPHTHDHLHGADHTHDHSHEHSHDHSHDHHHHHEHSAAPIAQLCALMNYMVDHNAAHADELAELAEQLRGAGKDAACEKVLSAVAEFRKGNDMLAEVLKELQ